MLSPYFKTGGIILAKCIPTTFTAIAGACEKRKQANGANRFVAEIFALKSSCFRLAIR